MSFVFSIGERGISSSWQASDHFVDDRTLTGVELGSGKESSEPSEICG